MSNTSAVVYCLKCGSTMGGAHYSNCPNLQTLVPESLPGSASTLLAQSAVPFDAACMKVRELEAAADEAADVLRSLAKDLRDCHTCSDGAWPEDENETRAEYESLLALADKLSPPAAREPVMPMMLY